MASEDPSVFRPGLGRIFRTGLVAAVAAAAVVVVVALVEVRLLQIEAAFQPLTPPSAVFVTVLYTLIGTGVLAVVCRVAADPRRTFIRVALIGLALSFLPQIGLLASGIEVPLGEFTVKNVLALSALHLVAAAVALPILLRVFRP